MFFYDVRMSKPRAEKRKFASFRSDPSVPQPRSQKKIHKKNITSSSDSSPPRHLSKSMTTSSPHAYKSMTPSTAHTNHGSYDGWIAFLKTCYKDRTDTVARYLMKDVINSRTELEKNIGSWVAYVFTGSKDDDPDTDTDFKNHVVRYIEPTDIQLFRTLRQIAPKLHHKRYIYDQIGIIPTHHVLFTTSSRNTTSSHKFHHPLGFAEMQIAANGLHAPTFKTKQMIIDTGASESCITLSTATDLGFDMKQPGIRTTNISGIHGAQTAQVVPVLLKMDEKMISSRSRYVCCPANVAVVNFDILGRDIMRHCNLNWEYEKVPSLGLAAPDHDAAFDIIDAK